MARRVDRLGEQRHNNQGSLMTIIKYNRTDDIDIEFENKYIVKNTTYQCFKEGTIKNHYLPTIYGIGYTGKGKYKSRENGAATSAYVKWFNIFERCYGNNINSYFDKVISEEWACFQNFAEWFYENFKDHMTTEWHLDKDILVKGNKAYSPETCCLVPPEINTLFIKSDKTRGDLPVGVKRNKNKFEVNFQKRGVDFYVGLFNTPEEAFQAYKIEKEKHIKEIADEWKPLIDPKVYKAMYNYKVEITD